MYCQASSKDETEWSLDREKLSTDKAISDGICFVSWSMLQLSPSRGVACLQDCF